MRKALILLCLIGFVMGLHLHLGYVNQWNNPGNYTIQDAAGKYLASCLGCSASDRAVPKLKEGDPSTDLSLIWTIQSIPMNAQYNWIRDQEGLYLLGSDTPSGGAVIVNTLET